MSISHSISDLFYALVQIKTPLAGANHSHINKMACVGIKQNEAKRAQKGKDEYRLSALRNSKFEAKFLKKFVWLPYTSVFIQNGEEICNEGSVYNLTKCYNYKKDTKT